ncbi:lipoyl(octanoyl) transferase [Chitinivorax tropicus]|uniref:Octanoyltransferase n=1 Tax=Chitinivorax tropicus TaxID=714531 RepID=A0A840MMU8_9PROT|nr:lipoyl(octanoyl) transferase LipB [Chitinivorax tropicus]MBB5019968.1 lipoyl(octanoyl) transferase [Chitinivorax tropicus]
MTWLVKHLGLAPYEPTVAAMETLTLSRQPDTEDELWLLQHPPTYTLGLAGKPEHLLQTTDIPVIRTERGGQITYHGPGQLVGYLLLDVRRLGYGVRELVRRMEQSIIDLLADQGISAYGREDAPGVYVAGAKIASLGLRIKNGCCYHGLALNVDMDLTPFNWINPCGYANMPISQLKDLGISLPIDEVAQQLARHLERNIVLNAQEPR